MLQPPNIRLVGSGPEIALPLVTGRPCGGSVVEVEMKFVDGD
jgi:hypothetical protein